MTNDTFLVFVPKKLRTFLKVSKQNESRTFGRTLILNVLINKTSWNESMKRRLNTTNKQECFKINNSTKIKQINNYS